MLLSACFLLDLICPVAAVTYVPYNLIAFWSACRVNTCMLLPGLQSTLIMGAYAAMTLSGLGRLQSNLSSRCSCTCESKILTSLAASYVDVDISGAL
jgi:hypothetical protein